MGHPAIFGRKMTKNILREGEQQQIPFGDDNQKGQGPSAALRFFEMHGKSDAR
jgi:hypothetical protein